VRLFQIGGQPVHVRRESRPVSVQFGMAVSHGLQFIEHDGDIPRHADLISPVIPSLECRSRRPDQLVDAVGQGDAVWRRPLVGMLQPGRFVGQQVAGCRHAER
jgi:hypothetical protein